MTVSRTLACSRNYVLYEASLLEAKLRSSLAHPVTIALWEPFCFSVEVNEMAVLGHYSSALRFLDVVYLGNSTVSLMARC